ncbi:MAG: hypothetical protein QOH46_2921 [Solirubrobacteraceae bacterium]|jgi:hypothetical protein|nr:hypothetical protein [Solirubrobacteraceae bacterium]
MNPWLIIVLITAVLIAIGCGLLVGSMNAALLARWRRKDAERAKK